MAEKLPIAFVHQELGLVDGLSVAENIALYRGFPLRRGLIDWPLVQREARDVLALMAADLDPAMPVGELPAAERALIGIARGLASKARLLVLDEPTAALPASDVERLHLPCAGSSRRASAFSMSPIASTRWRPSPTASPCCATAAMWRRGRSPARPRRCWPS